MVFAALPILLTGFSTQAGLIVAIGAQNTFVIRQGVARSHILPTVCICIAADIGLITLGTQGIGTLIAHYPPLLNALKWVGALILSAYGLIALRRACHAAVGYWNQKARVTHSLSVGETGGTQNDWMACPATWDAHASPSSRPAPLVSPTPSGSDKEQTLRGSVAVCCGFTFLNPGVYLDTLALLGGLAATYGGTMKWAFALGAMTCSIAWFSLLGALSTAMSRVFHSTMAWIALDGIVSLVMLCMAVHLALC